MTQFLTELITWPILYMFHELVMIELLYFLLPGVCVCVRVCTCVGACAYVIEGLQSYRYFAKTGNNLMGRGGVWTY